MRIPFQRVATDGSMLSIIRSDCRQSLHFLRHDNPTLLHLLLLLAGLNLVLSSFITVGLPVISNITLQLPPTFYGWLEAATADIDFERLKEIKNLVDVPLVFHGGSFSGFENIAECCRIGTQKVNMGTDAYNYGLDCLFHDGRYQNGENIGARMAGDIMWAGYKERVMDYMKVTGSVGKNWIKIEN